MTPEATPSLRTPSCDDARVIWSASRPIDQGRKVPRRPVPPANVSSPPEVREAPCFPVDLLDEVQDGIIASEISPRLPSCVADIRPLFTPFCPIAIPTCEKAQVRSVDPKDSSDLNENKGNGTVYYCSLPYTEDLPYVPEIDGDDYSHPSLAMRPSSHTILRCL
jgi:hypothetical protein